MLSRILKVSKNLHFPIQFLSQTPMRTEISGLDRYRKSVRVPGIPLKTKMGLDDHQQKNLQDEKSLTRLFFRKMREPYHDFLMLPERGILQAKRLRALNETCVDLNKKGEVACCIRKRDNYDEVDFVLPRSIAFTMKRTASPHLRQYLIRFDEGTEREILCTMEAINFHDRILRNMI